MALKVRVQRGISDLEKSGAQESPGEATAQRIQGTQKSSGAQGAQNNKSVSFTMRTHSFCEIYDGHRID